MQVLIEMGGVARLTDADNFRAFDVQLSPGANVDDLAAGAAAAGRLDPDGEHIWVSPDWIRAQAKGGTDWAAGFEKMLVFAAKSGWMDAEGLVRAHIVRA